MRPHAPKPLVELLDGSDLVSSVLGAADAGVVWGWLDRFCAAHLGARVSECFLAEVSVGAAFGLRLRDGRRVLLKAHVLDRSFRFLEAVQRVQGFLSARGFPCPVPLASPAPFGKALATVEEFIDGGEHADAHEAWVRRAMAAGLCRQVALAHAFADEEALAPAWRLPPPSGLWPTPHNVLFDFDATSGGAEWIDDLARGAVERLASIGGRVVVGHTDWSVKHFRFQDGRVRVIYDWDSLRRDRETVIVGGAAAHFTYSEALDVVKAPSIEESRSFVADYEAARDARFGAAEREAIDAAITYATAYTARCEHALDPRGAPPAGSFRAKLAAISH